MEHELLIMCRLNNQGEGGDGRANDAGKRLSYYDYFFFSSRRRHTRFDCDWSSDVCSSDLVTANSAPASTFHAKRDSSRSRSTAPGFTPTPIAQRVGAPIGLFPGSSPWFRRNTRLVSPIESMSNTAVASGYGPIFGGSPVMIRMLRSPAACAPRMSEHMPCRLRHRQQ